MFVAGDRDGVIMMAAQALKDILRQVRSWCLEVKKSQAIKSFWYLMALFCENQNAGLTKTELIEFLSQNEPDRQIPPHLRKTHGDFGYRYTLSRTFDEVMAILQKKKWVQQTKHKTYRLTPAGINELTSRITADKTAEYNVAAYGVIPKNSLMERLA